MPNNKEIREFIEIFKKFNPDFFNKKEEVSDLKKEE